MTKMSDMPFKSIKVGMKFEHFQHGLQIILDLDRNNFGPIIRFHASDIYSGKIPEMMDEDEDIFKILARNTFPSGAEEWEYAGMVTAEEIDAHGWQWYEVACPHCGSQQHLIAPSVVTEQRQCLVCGMNHNRPIQPSTQPASEA